MLEQEHGFPGVPGSHPQGAAASEFLICLSPAALGVETRVGSPHRRDLSGEEARGARGPGCGLLNENVHVPVRSLQCQLCPHRLSAAARVASLRPRHAGPLPARPTPGVLRLRPARAPPGSA